MVSKNDKQRTVTGMNPESEYVGTEQGGQEGLASNAGSEREEISQAAQAFVNSLIQAGTDFVKIPVKMLPQESREHFLAAGRELSQGWSKLAGRFADELDKMVNEERRTR